MWAVRGRGCVDGVGTGVEVAMRCQLEKTRTPRLSRSFVIGCGSISKYVEVGLAICVDL